MQRVLATPATRGAGGAQNGAAPLPAASVSDAWREVLCRGLDAELAPHIVKVLLKPRELVVFTDSAAWCSRLKLAQAQLGAIVAAREPGIAKVQIRVMPAGAAS